jgi:hypothetical protein
MNLENDFEKLWNLNPVGDKGQTYFVVKAFIQSQQKTTDGQLVTFDKTYELYENYCSFLEGFQKGGFTKKEKEIKDIIDFIQQGEWKKSFKSPKRTRDDYLFGPHSEAHINKKLKEFNAWRKTKE